MTAKIVYYGPGLCGKTTNLLVIFDKLDPKSKGKMLSLATKTDRTLFFDLLPVDIGKVGNFNLKIQLYTVPGQVFYNETRKLVLKGADSVVFVADSQPSMVESNKESFANLLDNLRENQLDPNDIPIVIQFNKRDIPGVLPVEELQERLNFEGYPYAEASAIKGTGVMETFKLVSKITAKHLITRLKGGKPESKDEKKRVAAAKSAAAAAPRIAVATPPPEPEPIFDPAPVNPFATSVPFPEAALSVAEDYERAEEVSLDQLLEGRERPATIGGSTPVPVTFADEEIDELSDETMIAIEEPPAPPPPARPRAVPAPPPQAAASSAGNGKSVAALEAEVARLESQVASLKSQHHAALDDIVRSLGELTERVRRQFDE